MTFQALLFCPDEKTARITTQILNELEFSVEACTEPFVAVKKLMGQHFDAIVVDCENEQNASLLFKSARNSSSNQGALAVAVVEGQAGVANAFRVGANLVLTKPINVEQAKSTLRVARGLLRKGSDAKASGAPATSPAAAPASKPAIPVAKATRASATPVSKPPLPAIQKSKPEPVVAAKKPSIEAEDLFEGLDQGTSAAQAAEEPVLETTEGPAPAASESKRAVSQEYPWQAVSKPAGARAPSLQRALETASKNAAKPATPQAPQAAPKPTVTPQQGLPPVVPALARGGAASAPAPAKESPRTSPAAFAAHTASREHFSPPISGKPSATVGEPPEPVSAPSFAALDLQQDDGTSGGGAKKGVLVAVLVVVLAAAAYFGYTKFVSSKHAHPAASVPAEPQGAAPTETSPQTEEITVGGPATTAQVPRHMSGEATMVRTPVTVKGSTASAASPNASEKEFSDEPEVTVTHPDAPKLFVKSDVGSRSSKTRPAAVEPVAPPALSTLGAEDSSAISSLVKSTPVSVPKATVPAEILKVSQGVTQGMLLKRVQPIYPQQALQMHVHGSVVLQAVIGKTGNISSVKVLSGDAVLARAAVQAVNQWKYKPYYLNGDPVEIQTQITVNFKLPNE